MMSKKAAAAGRWAVRPFDPKCRDFEPVDDAVVDQIRAVIAEWLPGDWPPVLAILEVEVPSVVGRLATLTVRDVRLLFNAIVHRGHGQRHTAHTAIVPLAVPLPASLAADVEWYSENCDDRTHGLILRSLLGSKSTNKSRAVTMGDVGRAVGTPSKPADLSRPFGDLVDRDLVRSVKGVGTWLTQRGEALARHLDVQKTSVRKVRLSPER
jgi:hypothetical protein